VIFLWNNGVLKNPYIFQLSLTLELTNVHHEKVADRIWRIICMCVCMCMFMCVCVHAYVRAYVRIFVTEKNSTIITCTIFNDSKPFLPCVRICMRAWAWTCACVCVYICVYMDKEWGRHPVEVQVYCRCSCRTWIN